MKKIIYGFTLYIFSLQLLSCNKLVDVPPPIDKVTTSNIFNTDIAATSAVLGIYSQMMYVYLNLSSGATTIYTGLSSDELSASSVTSSDQQEFANNSISPGNGIISSRFWSRPYACIYQINACIEGLTKSTTLSPAVKNQLLGESKFARAFIYFYMINLFGDVPFQSTTDYNINQRVPRTPVQEIKAHILVDLNEAISLLGPQYPTSGPVRPNKYTALALLARQYLYEKKWAEAEATASQIIDSKTYSLNNNLNNVFLANSSEAIWQLISMRSSYRSLEGNNFIPNASSTSPPSFYITKQLMAAFEKGDKRRSMWTNYLQIGSDTFYYPYKYKSANATPDPSTDYYTVFRLAEQHLIRAESRAQQGNIKGAADDLNLLRSRSRDEAVTNALPEIPYTLTSSQMILAVEQENRIEFFCEWGHRWFDLIRHNEADQVLKPLKAGWQPTDVLYPIPSSEILTNTTLKQNPGYN